MRKGRDKEYQHRVPDGYVNLGRWWRLVGLPVRWTEARCRNENSSRCVGWSSSRGREFGCDDHDSRSSVDMAACGWEDRGDRSTTHGAGETVLYLSTQTEGQDRERGRKLPVELGAVHGV